MLAKKTGAFVSMLLLGVVASSSGHVPLALGAGNTLPSNLIEEDDSQNLDDQTCSAEDSQSPAKHKYFKFLRQEIQDRPIGELRQKMLIAAKKMRAVFAVDHKHTPPKIAALFKKIEQRIATLSKQDILNAIDEGDKKGFKPKSCLELLGVVEIPLVVLQSIILTGILPPVGAALTFVFPLLMLQTAFKTLQECVGLRAPNLD